MRIVLFVEKMDVCRKCLPEHTRAASPLQEREGLGIYEFENHIHRLHLIETGEQKRVEIRYRSGSLILKTPPFTETRISTDYSPCLVVVHHWGRGRSFHFNGRRPEVQALQTGLGLQRSWRVVSWDRCVAAASGGSDPISDLLKCFFELEGKSSRVLEEMEAGMRAGMRKRAVRLSGPGGRAVQS